MKLFVAHRFFARARGLLGRPRLKLEEGLWLKPCRSVHTFGMHYAIDLVFIDRGAMVVKCVQSLSPGSFSACPNAHSVIELAPQTIKQAGIKPGMFLKEIGCDEYVFAV
jgi:uncharacterized protein